MRVLRSSALGCMGTTIHYTRMYVCVCVCMCAIQEINALCILSLDNTNAFQDPHSAVSCFRVISAQSVFQEFFEDFTVWFYVEKHLGVKHKRN